LLRPDGTDDELCRFYEHVTQRRFGWLVPCSTLKSKSQRPKANGLGAHGEEKGNHPLGLLP